MIINHLLEQYTQLRFKLDRLNERERKLALLVTIACLIFIWYIISYLPQTNAINNIHAAISAEIAEKTKLHDKRSTLEMLVKDSSVNKLIAKYKQLQANMEALEKNIRLYQARFIDDAQLNNLLFSILQQTPGVSITEFGNISVPPVTTVPNSPQPSNAPTTPPAPQVNSTITPNLAEEHNAEHIVYKLALQGSFFAIKNYLTLLEQSGWQLYWDKFDYVVKHYPEATATIEFYTLKPIEPPSETIKGASK